MGDAIVIPQQNYVGCRRMLMRLFTFYFSLFLSSQALFEQAPASLQGRVSVANNLSLAKMGTKVKGLLRGLRYFSQVFDGKEEEMQIGYPTDVKHVAHIGLDGPSANTPSWMNEFKSSEEPPNGPTNTTADAMNLLTNPLSKDTSLREKPKHKSRRPSTGADSPLNSTAQKSSDAPKPSGRQLSATDSPLSSPRGSDAQKHHRRRHSANMSMESPRGESSGSIRTRRRRNANHGAEAPTSEDQPSIPKHSRGRKPKISERSSRSSRAKDRSSSTDANPIKEPGSGDSGSVQGTMNTANHLSSVLEAYEEER